MKSNWELFVNQFVTENGYRLVLQGLQATLIISIFGLIFGFILGSLIAVVKLIPSKRIGPLSILKGVADIYITIFRGTPMVVQLLVLDYVFLPSIGVVFDSIIIGSFIVDSGVIEAVLAFALNSAAYIAEIMRGGINSVDKGQLEAGRALGLSYSKTMVKIVVPQAFKNVLPTLGNEFIALIKETSVASFIAVVDLTKAFQDLAAPTYEYVVPYLMLALFYLVLVILISQLVRLLEKKLKKSSGGR